MNTLILEKNEIATDKWVHPPKFGPNMNVIDRLKFFHDTKRYFIIIKLKQVNFSLYVVSFFLSIFQNRLTEIVYSQINLALSKVTPLVNTVGCLISVKKSSTEL